MEDFLNFAFYMNIAEMLLELCYTVNNMFNLDPTSVLLGVSMVTLTASATLALLVHHHPPIARILFGTLAVSLLGVVGIVIVDMMGAGVNSIVTEQTAALSLAAATHRRLLIMLPILLSTTSLFVLSVYHERIAEKHARDYRNSVSFASGISLIATIVIAIESMI